MFWILWPNTEWQETPFSVGVRERSTSKKGRERERENTAWNMKLFTIFFSWKIPIVDSRFGCLTVFVSFVICRASNWLNRLNFPLNCLIHSCFYSLLNNLIRLMCVGTAQLMSSLINRLNATPHIDKLWSKVKLPKFLSFNCEPCIFTLYSNSVQYRCVTFEFH